ncbi:MAG: carbohydrate ABC transporter permease [bacterium]
MGPALLSRKKMSKMARREAMEGYLFVMPWILGFLVFSIGPLMTVLWLGLFDYDLVDLEFTGFENYRKLLFEDPLFWISLRVTFMYSGAVIPIHLVLGLAIALIMNQKLRGVMAFRAIYYMPSIVTGVAAALIWVWLLNPEYGLINYFLRMVHIPGPKWLASETWALPALVLMSTWGVGGGMLIYLAGLQNIPTELYEAATIDGAGAWGRFWYITIPMLSPVVLFNLIIGVINSFQVFTQAYVMTQGGPHYATLFYALYLYQRALLFGKFGYASAMATILFWLILILTILILNTSSKWVFYGGERR